MCLARIFSDEEMAEYLEGQPEVIEVYKCVGIRKKVPVHISWDWGCSRHIYKGGLNIATTNEKIEANSGQLYWSGFHHYAIFGPAKIRAKSGLYDSGRYEKLQAIKCFIKKDWITAIGEEEQRANKQKYRRIIIITSQNICPYYPDTEARYEDLPKEKITEMAAAKNENQDKAKVSPRGLLP